MASDRKIQFATQVITKKEVQQPAVGGILEEYDLSVAAYQHDVMYTLVNKSLGGNGYIDINRLQWGDGWTSFTAPQGSDWEDNINNWGTATNTWDGIVTISSTPIQLSSDSSTMAFCYIKNTGSNAVKVTLEYGAGTPTYPFKIPVAGSVQFKGYSTNLAINKIGVVRVSSDSTIEYVIAKA